MGIGPVGVDIVDEATLLPRIGNVCQKGKEKEAAWKEESWGHVRTWGKRWKKTEQAGVCTVDGRRRWRQANTRRGRVRTRSWRALKDLSISGTVRLNRAGLRIVSCCLAWLVAYVRGSSMLCLCGDGSVSTTRRQFRLDVSGFLDTRTCFTSQLVLDATPNRSK